MLENPSSSQVPEKIRREILKGKDASPEVQLQLARDLSTSINILLTLSLSSDGEVLEELAKHPHIPYPVFITLIHSPTNSSSNLSIKEAILANPAIPTEILEKLTEDQNSKIRELAMRELYKKESQNKSNQAENN
jgi:hypothetical protein